MTTIRCRATDGQFSDELAVMIEDYQGRAHSLFTPRSNVTPEGNLKVAVCERTARHALIRLPSELLEPGGYHLNVRLDQLQEPHP